jgi:hypothetical protein
MTEHCSKITDKNHKMTDHCSKMTDKTIKWLSTIIKWLSTVAKIAEHCSNMIESLSGLGARGRWRARGLWVGRSVAALTRLVGWLAGLVQVIDQWIHHLASVCIYIYTRQSYSKHMLRCSVAWAGPTWGADRWSQALVWVRDVATRQAGPRAEWD